MDDPSKVVVIITLAVTFVTSIKLIASAVLKYQEKEKEQELQSPMASSAADARLARLEVAVDSIALEIERISEGQRFTTRLLSEQVKQPLVRAETPDFRVNTPH